MVMVFVMVAVEVVVPVLESLAVVVEFYAGAIFDGAACCSGGACGGCGDGDTYSGGGCACGGGCGDGDTVVVVVLVVVDVVMVIFTAVVVVSITQNTC